MMESQPSDDAAENRIGSEPDGMLPVSYSIGGMAYFGYRLAVTAKRFDRKFVELLTRHSTLTLPQWRVIAQLGLAEPGTVRSLADGAEVDRAEVSRSLAQLEKAGLVRREDNQRDQRSPHFRLTERGRETFTEVRQPVAQFIRGIVASVDPADIAAADRVLEAVWRGCAR